MREILFKAKALGGMSWEIGNLFCGCDGKCQIGNGRINFRTFVEVDPETICQYTGLTDKNGVKIFENDVIRFVPWSNKIMERAVRWDEEHCRFCVWLDGASSAGVNRYLSDDIEVIGNIHDKEG